MVRPKKALGQHFLTDRQVARRIVDAFQPEMASLVVEIGPGTGALSGMLVERFQKPVLLDIDSESIDYLRQQFPESAAEIVHGDFLETGLSGLGGERFAIIGNFPYNISSQIFFRILEERGRVDHVVCMIQKEVAQRIAAPPGGRACGILSILLQAYYDVRILFHVPPGVFNPPPKVMSSVVRLQRNQVRQLDCDEELFFRLVKRAFGNRRKTLRNALKDLNLHSGFYASDRMGLRAEQLRVADFVELTQIASQH